MSGNGDEPEVAVPPSQLLQPGGAGRYEGGLMGVQQVRVDSERAGAVGTPRAQAGHPNGPLYVALFVFAFTIIYGGVVFFSDLSFITLLVLHVLTAFLLLAYFACCFWDPGFVPQDWNKADLERQPLNSAMGDASSVGSADGQRGTPFCEHCQLLKPPRAHHCRFCQKCVSRYEHHCVYTNNCVGFTTQRPFLQLLFYLLVLTVASLIIQGRQLFLFPAESAMRNFYLLFSTICSAFSLVMTGLQAYKQWPLSAANLTSVEQLEIGFEQDRARFLNLEPCETHRYDHSVLGNLKIALGPKIWQWFLPSPLFNHTPTDSMDDMGHAWRSNAEGEQCAEEYQRRVERTLQESYRKAGLIK